MGKFKVGDRIISKKFGFGIVKEIGRDDDVLVEFDVENRTLLHDGRAFAQTRTKPWRGYWCLLDSIEHIKPLKINIRQHDREVVATLQRGKEVIKTAKAKCNPSDEFNFEFGAKLAVERLTAVDVKRVSRRAEVGEWIEITDSLHKTIYSNGEIYQVKGLQRERDGGFSVSIGKIYVVKPSEYVVLENYTPSTPPQRTPLSEYSNREISEELLRRFSEVK